ncbi:MAG TPA: hypothetical protein VGB50_06545 [Flavobacterium sp.]|jgi:hypothetical protein
MKNIYLLFAAITTVVCFSGFAQRGGGSGPTYGDMEDTRLMSDMPDELIVASYHVVERINMNFGGRITTYDVSDERLISKVNLGPNNTRTVTPRYAKKPKEKTKEEAVAITTAAAVLHHEQPEASLAVIPAFAEPAKVEPVKAQPVVETAKVEPVATEEKKYVNIDIVDTYERILEKGYKSVDMLRKVANNRYFDGDLAKAAKWYSQLIAQTNDLEPEFYFRYSKALRFINQVDKANEMMKIFESKNM